MKQIIKVGVVGEGKMGTSIFLHLNGFDFHLTWLCSSETEKESALKLVRKKTRFLHSSGLLSEEQFINKTDQTIVTCSAGDLKDCDLIIEAITENIDSKRMLFALLDKNVNQECIFASNSSSILPSELGLASSRIEKIAGLHFFFPVPMKNTVELIAGTQTSEDSIESLRYFLHQINKIPFQQTEVDAFVLNRVLLNFQAAACQILFEGKLSIMEIDFLVKRYLFPIGAFEFFDHVGIDVMLASVKAYTRKSENPSFYAPLIHKMEELVAHNRLGIKTRTGFYDYSIPVESSIMNPDIDKDPDNYKIMVTEKLWQYYIESVESFLNSGVCTKEELATYIKDYLGSDNDPFSPIIAFK